MATMATAIITFGNQTESEIDAWIQALELPAGSTISVSKTVAEQYQAPTGGGTPEPVPEPDPIAPPVEEPAP